MTEGQIAQAFVYADQKAKKLGFELSCTGGAFSIKALDDKAGLNIDYYQTLAEVEAFLNGYSRKSNK